MIDAVAETTDADIREEIAAALQKELDRVASILMFFFFSSRRRHTRFDCDWSSDVCSSDLRASAEWRARRLADPERVERYGRFLARHFYYERLVHFFKYSRALARVTGRRPEAILRRPGFDALLPTAVLGSRETARAVARLAVEYVSEADAPIPYLADLLRYEEAMMVVEAGPRQWRDSDGAAGAGSRERYPPEKVEGTLLVEVAFDLPPVLPILLQPWTEVPPAPVRPTKLLG